jgi:phosphoribosylformimino-5-aminoimidazole carboxamide ribotide isomerase
MNIMLIYRRLICAAVKSSTAARRSARTDYLQRDPVATARRWQAAGVRWLYVVASTRARRSKRQSWRARQLAELACTFSSAVALLGDAAQALEAGISRVILGTLAIEEPQQVAEAIRRFGAEAVVVALDAKDGHIATHGWQAETPWTPTEMGQRFAWMGLRYALFTDIRRDGDLSGANLAATAALAAETGLRVIASGGVASLDDIRALLSVQPPLDGVVIGTALYTR